MKETETKPLPEETLEFLKARQEESDKLRQRVHELEAANAYLNERVAQLEDVKLNLEVANKRWLNAINEGVQYEVALLKLQRNNNG